MRLLPFLSSLVLVAACSDTNSENPNVADANAAIATGQQNGTTLAGQAQTELSGADPLSADAKIGSIMHTLNTGEIMVAQTALQQTSDGTATDFANMMVTQHTQNDQMLQSMMTGEGITFRDDNAVTPQLMTEATAAQGQVQGSGDTTHDYLVTQVQMHTEAFILVGALIDQASDPSLQSYLTDTQNTISMHRADAIDRLQSL